MHMQSRKSSITLSLITALALGLLAGRAEAFKPMTTKVIKGGDKPLKISVDITGLKDLWLLATSGPDDYHHDRAAWGSPVLIDTAGKKIDLTTLKPAITAGHGGLRINKGLSSNVLQIGRKKFKKGLLLHGPSSMHFKLDGKYVRFEAEVGIGAGAGKNGSCTFRVLDKYDPAGMKKYPLGRKVTSKKAAVLHAPPAPRRR